MSDMNRKWPPLDVGTWVKVSLKTLGYSTGYRDDAVRDRIKLHGKIGVIEGHSDSHGLCYKVREANTENSSFFEPSELEEIPR